MSLSRIASSPASRSRQWLHANPMRPRRFGAPCTTRPVSSVILLDRMQSRSLSGSNGMSDTYRLADGSFRNPWPDSDVPGWLGVPRVLVENVAGRLRTRHSRVALEKATPTVAYPRAHERAFTATWIGHSTVLLQIGGLNVLTDPVFCRRASPVQWMGPARMIEPAL